MPTPIDTTPVTEPVVLDTTVYTAPVTVAEPIVVCGLQPVGETCNLIIYGNDVIARRLPATGATSAPVVGGASLSLLAGVALACIARRTRRPVRA